MGDAKSRLNNAKETESIDLKSVLSQTEYFRSQQESLEERLVVLTSSETPDKAVKRLKAPIEKLQRLEVASAYAKLLNHVEDLTSDVRFYLPNNSKAAIKPYTRLTQLSASLQSLQGPAEGAAGHIITFVKNRGDLLFEELKHVMIEEFQGFLKEIKWPVLAEIKVPEFASSIGKLLDLQLPELIKTQPPVILLPMAVLTTEFVQQFRYHFMGSKTTNIKNSFEDACAWIVELVARWTEWLYHNVAPILAEHFSGTELVECSIYVDPVNAFVTALLPVVREKVYNVLSVVSEEPAQMERTIVSLMRFDDKLRRQLRYDGGDPINGWMGLTAEVLKDHFNTWLNVEKDFTLKRYEDIINAQQSGKIDSDSPDPGQSKPTYGAVKIVDLLNSVTKLYHGLRDFSQRLRFLIDIQLTILDEYHKHLYAALETNKSLTSAVSRTLHGVTKEQQAILEGSGALESLCKIYGSAEHVVLALSEWSNDPVSTSPVV